jgi:hypothetical protein
MLNTHVGTVQFQTLHASNICRGKYFKISATQCPSNHSPAKNGDVLDTVVHKIIRPTHATVFDILESDHLQIGLHIHDYARNKTFPEIYSIYGANNYRKDTSCVSQCFKQTEGSLPHSHDLST